MAPTTLHLVGDLSTVRTRGDDRARRERCGRHCAGRGDGTGGRITLQGGAAAC